MHFPDGPVRLLRNQLVAEHPHTKYLASHGLDATIGFPSNNKASRIFYVKRREGAMSFELTLLTLPAEVCIEVNICPCIAGVCC